MVMVPSNLIPTRISQLPTAPVASPDGLLMFVYNGVTYKVRAGDLLQVAGVPTSTQVIAGTGMTGGGQLTGNVTLSVAAGGIGATQLASTGVTPGAYGDVTHIPSLTISADGRVTAATTVEVAGGSGSGTVTSVGATVPSFLSAGPPVTTSGNIVISYSGTALPLANGGTGATSAQLAMNSLAGGTTSGSYLRGNGTNVTLSTIQAADVPTLNQNTTGNAATVTTNANLTGVVTSVGNATSIAAGAISNAMLTNGAVANLSGTNTGDNAVNSLYSGLVSNATHTGDATGATALTVVRINGVALSGLATGILKNTTATGVPSIAIAGDFPTLNQNTTGTAAALAGGTAGVVPYQSATGVTAFLSEGTVGQVLTSAGPGLPPAFATAGGASVNQGSASIVFTNSNEASIAVVGQTGILAGSSVWAVIRGDDTSVNHTASDHKYFAVFAALTVSAPTAGVGFTIYARSEQKLNGTFTIRWNWM